ncbi:NAD(P)-binding protein [Thozetella sp. PMI_491]|nr:NAD(P)-binding protein [Thozetella sp. PMI_491]
MAAHTVLVVGATGQQGGAVVQALLDQKRANLRILALTRNPDSPKAKALAKAHKDVIELVRGDASEPEPILSSQPKGSIDGLFIVTSPGKVDEEKQAIPLIDAAVAHGVSHIVFSSVERGGDEKSWTNPTDIKHFYQKHNIELYLRDKAQKDGSFTWTIFRPVAFLDNMNPGKFVPVFAALWYVTLSPGTKLQFVSTHDIGVLSAKALIDPSKWAGKAIGLAGDSLTLTEAKAIYKQTIGKDLPQHWSLFAWLLTWVPELNKMFTFFEKEGYGVDIEALNKIHPMQNLETWLKESSKWK